MVLLYITSEREIDGEAFCHLSREDIATIFPAPKQFILGSKLYKLVQRARSSDDDSSINTSELLGDLDETLSRSSKLCASISASTSSEFSRKRSKAGSDSAPQPKKQHSDTSSSSASDRSFSSAGECSSFKLPVFSPDVQKCISNDAFYTPTQSNRLIKQSCVALRGYCWEHGNPVSNSDKETLAKKLYELAPKTLGNPGSAKKSPYISMYISLSYTNINNDYNLYLVG